MSTDSHSSLDGFGVSGPLLESCSTDAANGTRLRGAGPATAAATAAKAAVTSRAAAALAEPLAASRLPPPPVPADSFSSAAAAAMRTGGASKCDDGASAEVAGEVAGDGRVSLRPTLSLSGISYSASATGNISYPASATGGKAASDDGLAVTAVPLMRSSHSVTARSTHSVISSMTSYNGAAAWGGRGGGGYSHGDKNDGEESEVEERLAADTAVRVFDGMASWNPMYTGMMARR